MKYTLFSLLVILVFAACDNEEVETPLQKNQFVRLISNQDSKTWTLERNGEASPEACETGTRYRFSGRSGSTEGVLSIRNPETDCTGLPFTETIVSTAIWKLTDNESSLFDGTLSVEGEGQTITYRVQEIFPDRLVLRNTTTLEDLVLSFEL